MRPYLSLITIAGLIALVAAGCASLAAQQPAGAAPQLAPPQLAKDPGAFPGIANASDGGGRGKQVRPKGGPAPHFPDGRPDFGGDGAWYPGFGGNLAETQWKGVKSADTHVDVQFLPAALKLFNQRVESLSKDDPEARCLPVGVPRYMFDPYPFQMVQTSDKVVFLFEGDNYPWRIVYLDPTRGHPRNLKPSWIGDAIGHYEGDTLVVDVTGFNGKAWLDQAGHPQTQQQHLTERYTRADSLTLKYEVTIEDPGAYAAPWTASNTVYWRPGFKLMEFVCEENEKDALHMIGNDPAGKK